MVRSTRQRSQVRLLGTTHRFGRTRPALSERITAKVVRFPKMKLLLQPRRSHRQHDDQMRLDERMSRDGVEEQHFFDQLRQLAKVFPDSRVIQE